MCLRKVHLASAFTQLTICARSASASVSSQASTRHWPTNHTDLLDASRSITSSKAASASTSRDLLVVWVTCQQAVGAARDALDETEEEELEWRAARAVRRQALRHGERPLRQRVYLLVCIRQLVLGLSSGYPGGCCATVVLQA